MNPAPLEEVLSALESEASLHPEIALDLELHLALLRKTAAVIPSSHAPLIEQGKDGYDLSTLSVDWDAALSLARAVLDETSARRADLLDALTPLRTALEPRAFTASAMNYLRLGVAELPGGASLDGRRADSEALWGFVLNHALRPWLRALASAVLPTLELEKWGQGKCPVCGGAPDFAALSREGKAEGGRILLCSRCDAEWPFRRVACPYCGDHNHKNQGYYPVGEDGRYRLYVCEACGGYIKTVDLRAVDNPLPLPAERILTLGLDVAAIQAGYGRAQESRA